MVTLRNILESMENEENLSIQLLAGKLEDSPEAVLSALELLEQMGRVRRISMSLHCGHGCKGCVRPCPHKTEEQAIWWELA